MTRALVLPDVFELARSPETIAWEEFAEGVMIHWLYRTDDGGPAAALIQFLPGTKVMLHEHRGYEHILVLRGSQSDESGHLQCGGLMINPPGTRHSISSEEGCIVLAIYERRVSFHTLADEEHGN